MKKIWDISLPVSPKLPVWQGDPPVRMERVMKLEEGDVANVTTLNFGAHTGTHLDASYHFISNGRKIDEIPLEEMIGKAQVVRIADGIDMVTREVLASVSFVTDITRVLFKTRNSSLWSQPNHLFDTRYVGLDASAAQYLVDSGIRLVGIDYLSVAPFENQVDTHNILLGAEVLILEGLDLRGVEEGIYTLLCLPVRLEGVDGAPARAVLIEGNPD